MNLSKRKPTLSITLATYWFVLNLLMSFFSFFIDGIGFNLLSVIIFGMGLFAIAYRYPWGRIYSIVLLSITLTQLILNAIYFSWITSKSIYTSLTVTRDIAINSYLEQKYIQQAFIIIILIVFIALFIWMIFDLIRNKDAKEYFVTKEDLKTQKQST